MFVKHCNIGQQTLKSLESLVAQAINDFSVFGMSAAASLMAGVVLFELGWTTLLLSTLPVLLLLLFAILWERRRTGSAPAESRTSTTADPSTSRDHGNE